ncbi:MAG: hypothetical protein ACK4K4_01550 [Caldimicrobium sp.]
MWKVKFLDVYTALALSLIVLVDLNFYSLLTLFILGILRGFEGNYPFFFFSIYYLLFMLFNHYYFKQFFKKESLIPLFLFWSLAIIVLISGETIFFLYRSVVYNLTLKFWLFFLLKSLLYGFIILILTFLFYKLGKRFIVLEE